MKQAVIIALLAVTMTAGAQTIDDVRAELKRQGVPCAEIVLAQARLETGNFKSRLCKQSRNLFGIKHGGKYARYRNWRESIADYKRRISSRYRGGCYYAFLRRIGYAADKSYINKLKRF